MKRNALYIIATGLLLSVGAATAQVQTGTGTPTSTPSAQGTSNYNSTGMTPVNSSALPDPLTNTLQNNQQYNGWQSGQWYYNSTTNQYSVQMPTSTSGTGTSTNPLGSTSTSPTSQSNPMGGLTPTSSTNPTTSTVNPMSTTPASGMQLPGSTTTTPTWYKFDQNGRLIPQPN